MDEYKGIEEGQNYLDDADIPDDKKQELIETLWNIVVQFVDMGYGIESTQQVMGIADDQKQTINNQENQETML